MLNSIVIKNFQQFKNFFNNAGGFRHVVIDNFFEKLVAKSLLKAKQNINNSDIFYHHVNEKKEAISKIENMPSEIATVMHYLNSSIFLSKLESLTGYKNLIPDFELNGGGIHITRNGGYLEPHLDFKTHPIKKKWKRVLNLIIYLNENWEDNFNGHLCLYNIKDRSIINKIAPLFNRAVLFETNELSIHGHPDKLNTPHNIYRVSLALYYYIHEENISSRSTQYFSTPSDSRFRAVAKFFDNYMLSIYHFLRTKGLINDKFLSSII